MTVLITAGQAYPAFESLFLNAERKIELGFRIFDPTTKLHSAAAKEIGQTWSDLILATLNRGVDINITLSDFDPIVGPDLHRGSFAAVQIFHAINEMTVENAGRIHVKCLLHPAQGGFFARLLFAIQTRKKLRKIAAEINEDPNHALSFKSAPRLGDSLMIEDGKVVLRPRLLPKIYPVTLHQKMAVIDGHTTYIGGLDLNNRRFDTLDHKQSAQQTWHDLQLIIKCPAIARDASAFLKSLPETSAGCIPPPAIKSGFRTTLSAKRRSNTFTLAPKTISDGLLQEHLKQIASAQHFIYIETQYFRDRRIAKALVAAAKRAPHLQVLLMLPAAPEDVAFEGSRSADARYGAYLQTRAISQVHKAFGSRFYVTSPVQPRSTNQEDSDMERASLQGAPIVYVHAKLAVFDDTSAIVASANLNGRSMKWDVETGVVLTDADQVKTLREAALQHWLPNNADASYFARDTAYDRWCALASENASRTPDARLGFVMPYNLSPAKSLSMIAPGAPEELV